MRIDDLVLHPLVHAHELRGQVDVRRVDGEEQAEDDNQVEDARFERLHNVRGRHERVLNEQPVEKVTYFFHTKRHFCVFLVDLS